jgi:hypothetical protein
MKSEKCQFILRNHIEFYNLHFSFWNAGFNADYQRNIERAKISDA